MTRIWPKMGKTGQNGRKGLVVRGVGDAGVAWWGLVIMLT